MPVASGTAGMLTKKEEAVPESEPTEPEPEDDSLVTCAGNLCRTAVWFLEVRTSTDSTSECTASCTLRASLSLPGTFFVDVKRHPVNPFAATKLFKSGGRISGADALVKYRSAL